MAAGDSTEARVRIGLEKALLHPAREDHIQILKQLYNETLSQYRDDEVAARKLTGEGFENVAESAAMVVVANVIMNLDEFLTR